MAATIPPEHQPEPPAERMAAARALFESTPGMDVDTVAGEVGVPVYWARRWKREQGWQKAGREMSSRAAEVADSFKTRMSDLGRPLDDAQAAAEVARELSVDTSVGVRAGVMDRHRKEWAAPRKIAYDAMQQAARGDVAGAFERAKLAKITAETLTLVQAGECRAYGITPDAKAGDGATVVVVERSSAPAVSEDPADADGEDF